MAERIITVTSSNGLHARPAALFTQAVAASGSQVTIQKAGGTAVDASSILGVLSQGIACNDEVTITVTGGDEAAVLDQLAEFLATNHDAA